MTDENKVPELWDLIWRYVLEPYGVLGLVLFALLLTAFFVWTQKRRREEMPKAYSAEWNAADDGLR